MIWCRLSYRSNNLIQFCQNYHLSFNYSDYEYMLQHHFSWGSKQAHKLRWILILFTIIFRLLKGPLKTLMVRAAFWGSFTDQCVFGGQTSIRLLHKDSKTLRYELRDINHLTANTILYRENHRTLEFGISPFIALHDAHGRNCLKWL